MEAEYQEVDLREYLRVLWQEKWVVIVTFIAAVAAALGVSHSLPKKYQTEIGLLILPPLSTEVGGEITGTVFSPQTYKSLALANDLIQATIDAVYPKGERPSLEAVKGGIKVEVEQTTAKDFPGRFPLHLRVTFTGTDPVKLKEMAEVWAEEFKSRNAELFMSRTAQSYDYIKQNFDQVDRELRAKEEERKTYEQEHPLEILQNEVKKLREIYAKYLTKLADRKQELAQARARLEALRTALSQEPEVIVLQRGLSRESLAEFLSQRLTREELEALPEIKIEDEVLNGTYITLRTEVARAQAEVSALEDEVTFLEAELKRVSEMLQEKQRELIEVEATLARINREIQVLTDSYQRLSAKLQEARIAQAETSEPIRVVEAPVVPSRPIGPNKKMNVAIAGVLGIFLGILLAFFIHYIHTVPPPSEHTHDEEAKEIS